MADEDVIDLTEFIEEDLYPKFTVASNVMNALLDQQKANQGKSIPLEEVIALNGKLRTATERYRLLEQQVLVIYDTCGTPLNTKTPINPSTDRRFMLWLAQIRTCADDPACEDLRSYYVKFALQK